VSQPADAKPTAQPRVPSTSGERLFAVLVLLYSTGAFWRILQGNRDPEPSGTWTGALLTNTLWILIYSIVFFLLRNRCVIPRGLWRKSFLMLLPIPIAVLSLAWTEDRLLTFLRCGALAGTTLVALYLALRFTIGEILIFAAWALGIAAIGSTIFALMIPSYGIGTGEYQGLWIGAFAQKNELGMMMSVGFLVYLLLLWHDRSHRMIWFSFAALSLFLVLRADSMTSFAVCCALPYLLWVSTKTLVKKQRVWIRLLYFALPISVLASGLALQFDRVVEAMGRSSDLTGRTILWGVVVSKAILDKPYLGYGYEAFWRGYESTAGEIWNELGLYQYYSHNGFLEILLGLGLLGLVAMLVAFVFFFKNALQSLQKQKGLNAVWPWALILYLLLSNLAEGNLMKSNNLPWLLYMITVLSLSINKVECLQDQNGH
jgi:exopolysaccharide production protein ExoQ